ncbi:MAG: tetratricopeptide repeat protein [Saprospiraceae bacterium]
MLSGDFLFFYKGLKKYLFLGIILSCFSICNDLFAQTTPLDSIDWWIDSTTHLSESRKETYLIKAAELAQQNQLLYQQAKAVLKLTILTMEQADYPKALMLQDSVLRMSQANQFDDLYSKALQQKGLIYSALERYEQANTTFLEALNLPYIQSKPIKKAEILNNLGIAAALNDENVAGLAYFQQAKAIFEQEGKVEDANRVLSNLAVLYMRENRVPEALKIFQEELALMQKLQDRISEAQAYGNVAYAHYLLGEYPQAFKAYNQSIAIAKAEGFNDVLAITYKDLAETYQTKGDFQKALATFQLYHDLHLKNVGAKTQQEVSALQVQYNTEVKNRQLAEQAEEIQLLEQKRIIRQQRFMVISILLGSLALMAMFLYWRKKTKLEQIQTTKSLKEQILQKELVLKEQQQKILKTELASKNKDITTLALDISRKNDFSRLMRRELEQLEKGLPKAYQSKIRNLKMNTLTHLEINEDVANLQNNIEQINHQFYENLDSIAKLSQSEKQICGLIRMNLSNKQIALIRNTTTDSAKVFRYRIRKKIGLQPDEDVVAFFFYF